MVLIAHLDCVLCTVPIVYKCETFGMQAQFGKFSFCCTFERTVHEYKWKESVSTLILRQLSLENNCLHGQWTHFPT